MKTCSIDGSVKPLVASTICVLCSSLKPFLAEENIWARVEMALCFRDLENPTKYQGMHDRIHLDEKWFFLTQEKERYLLLLKRKPKMVHKPQMPYHKGNVLVCCCKYSIYNPCVPSWWDGKLGFWPIGDLGTSQMKV